MRFQLDVGADVVVDEIEESVGSAWLEYCGIDTPMMRMISIEQQLAEKLHAYSLPREQRLNSRVKDLVDMLLLTELRQIDANRFNQTIQRVFKTRGTHRWPGFLEPPPLEWAPLYRALADECGIKQTMSQALSELNAFFQNYVGSENNSAIP